MAPHTILRETWGFGGFVVADYGAVTFLHQFAGVAEDGPAAAAMALRAGLDVELPSPVEFPSGIPMAIERGLLSIEDVDQATARVLQAKFRLGLFEQPFVDVDAIVMETPDERALATEVAEQSVTLLTNDGTLPVDPASVGRVAVLGPNADQVMALFGNYSFENHLVSIHYSESAAAVQVPTVLDALRDRFRSSVVEHLPGCESDERRSIGDSRCGRVGTRRRRRVRGGG